MRWVINRTPGMVLYIGPIFIVDGLPNGNGNGWKDISDPEFCAEFIYGIYNGLRRC